MLEIIEAYNEVQAEGVIIKRAGGGYSPFLEEDGTRPGKTTNSQQQIIVFRQKQIEQKIEQSFIQKTYPKVPDFGR